MKKVMILILILTVLLGAGCLEALEADSDNDGYSNREDAFPHDAKYHKDTDGDGYADKIDFYPDDTSKYLKDSDDDGYADNVDDFPNDPQYHSDLDSDGIADKVDTDIDGDGYDNEKDAFPANKEYHLDSDGDGYADENDATPNDSSSHTVKGAVTKDLNSIGAQHPIVHVVNSDGYNYVSITLNARPGHSLDEAKSITKSIGGRSYIKNNGYTHVDLEIVEHTYNDVPYWVYSAEYDVRYQRLQYCEEGPL